LWNPPRTYGYFETDGSFQRLAERTDVDTPLLAIELMGWTLTLTLLGASGPLLLKKAWIRRLLQLHQDPRDKRTRPPDLTDAATPAYGHASSEKAASGVSGADEEAKSEPADWPYKGSSRLAWAPANNPEAWAIPLHPGQKDLTREDYLAALVDRLTWAAEREDLTPEGLRQFLQCRIPPGEMDFPRGATVPQLIRNLVHSQRMDDLMDFDQTTAHLPKHPQSREGAVQSVEETSLLGFLNLVEPVDRS